MRAAKQIVLNDLGLANDLTAAPTAEASAPAAGPPLGWYTPGGLWLPYGAGLAPYAFQGVHWSIQGADPAAASSSVVHFRHL
eukprot:s209_g16.t1